jgi:hypothetical protein
VSLENFTIHCAGFLDADNDPNMKMAMNQVTTKQCKSSFGGKD